MGYLNKMLVRNYKGIDRRKNKKEPTGGDTLRTPRKGHFRTTDTTAIVQKSRIAQCYPAKTTNGYSAYIFNIILYRALIILLYLLN